MSWDSFRHRMLFGHYNRDFEDVTTRIGLLNIKSLEDDTLHDSVVSSRREDTTKVNMERMELYAEIDHDEQSDGKRLSVHINVTTCRTSELLSKDCNQLSQLGHGYSLETVKIGISPITNLIGNRKELCICKKPKLVKCPKISHTLEIKFNDLEHFNRKFASLRYGHEGAEELIFDVEKNIMPNPTTMTDSVIDIERSLVDEN